MAVNAEGLVALPADAGPRQLAMLTINPPTAHLLFETYVQFRSWQGAISPASLRIVFPAFADFTSHCFRWSP
jgi:hypothetical protein